MSNRTSSAGDFHAKTSAMRKRAVAMDDWESTESALDSGVNLHAYFARYDPACALWRTSQHCLDFTLEEFSQTWPRAGSMRGGTVSRRQPLVPEYFVIEFLSLPLPIRFSSPVASRRGTCAAPRKKKSGGNRFLEYDLALLGHRGPLNP